ncbi:MAG: Trk system potassium transporter TrkA [Candidatus Neomarinimicrobiota bacterium]
MKIVIIGAGEVGFHVAKSLSELDYDISVIDIDHSKCARANEHLDVIVTQGNGSDEKILKDVNVSEADYVFCLTNSDETNLISSLQCHNLGAKKIIARLRDLDYSRNGNALTPEKFGVDIVIHPEDEVAKEIIRLVMHPYADKFYEFEGGKAVLFSKKINHRSKISGLTVEEFHKINVEFKSLIVAVIRGEKMTIPTTTFKFEPEDYIFFFVRSKNLDQLLLVLGVENSDSKRVMIAGASKIGRRIASLLEDKMSVRLIEKSKEKATQIANNLDKTIVLNSDATDVEFLKGENISDVDSFVAVTEDQQLNLLAGILSKQLKVKHSIIHVTNPDYVRNMSDLGIGSIVSKNTVSVNAVIKSIRIDQKEHVIQLFSSLDMEAIELVADKDSKAARLPLSNLNLPHGCIVALVNHNGHIKIPAGGFQISENDSVLIFCINSKIREVSKIFNNE